MTPALPAAGPAAGIVFPPGLAAVPVLVPVATAPVAITPAQHHHFINLGQFVGLALLALTAYHAQDTSKDGPGMLLNPTVAAPYLAGILSLFSPQPSGAE